MVQCKECVASAVCWADAKWARGWEWIKKEKKTITTVSGVYSVGSNTPVRSAWKLANEGSVTGNDLFRELYISSVHILLCGFRFFLRCQDNVGIYSKLLLYYYLYHRTWEDVLKMLCQWSNVHKPRRMKGIAPLRVESPILDLAMLL